MKAGYLLVSFLDADTRFKKWLFYKKPHLKILMSQKVVPDIASGIKQRFI
jgi:hypothetical protein